MEGQPHEFTREVFRSIRGLQEGLLQRFDTQKPPSEGRIAGILLLNLEKAQLEMDRYRSQDSSEHDHAQRNIVRITAALDGIEENEWATMRSVLRDYAHSSSSEDPQRATRLTNLANSLGI